MAELTKEQENLVIAHSKVMGYDNAKKMVLSFAKTVIKTPDKVYIDELGREVHPKNKTGVLLRGYESLQQKIARFDALARMVRESRAIMQSVVDDMGSLDDFVDDDDKLDDSFVNDDLPTVDEFGDPVVAGPAKPEKPTATAVDADDAGSATSGDGPGEAGSTEPSGMPS